MTTPRQSARSYAFLTPAFLVMTLTGLIQMAIVAFYLVNDTFAGNSFFFVGAAWIKQVLSWLDFFRENPHGPRLLDRACCVISKRKDPAC